MSQYCRYSNVLKIGIKDLQGTNVCVECFKLNGFFNSVFDPH